MSCKGQHSRSSPKATSRVVANRYAMAKYQKIEGNVEERVDGNQGDVDSDSAGSRDSSRRRKSGGDRSLATSTTPGNATSSTQAVLSLALPTLIQETIFSINSTHWSNVSLKAYLKMSRHCLFNTSLLLTHASIQSNGMSLLLGLIKMTREMRSSHCVVHMLNCLKEWWHRNNVYISSTMHAVKRLMRYWIKTISNVVPSQMCCEGTWLSKLKHRRILLLRHSMRTARHTIWITHALKSWEKTLITILSMMASGTEAAAALLIRSLQSSFRQAGGTYAPFLVCTTPTQEKHADGKRLNKIIKQEMEKVASSKRTFLKPSKQDGVTIGVDWTMVGKVKCPEPHLRVSKLPLNKKNSMIWALIIKQLVSLITPRVSLRRSSTLMTLQMSLMKTQVLRNHTNAYRSLSRPTPCMNSVLPTLTSSECVRTVSFNVRSLAHHRKCIRKKKLAYLNKLAKRFDVLLLQEVHGSDIRVRNLLHELSSTFELFSSFPVLYRTRTNGTKRLREDTGGVVSAFRRSLFHAGTLSAHTFVPGRILCITHSLACTHHSGRADRKITNFYNIHNFDLPLHDLEEFRYQVDMDVGLSETNPADHFAIFGGDLNLQEGSLTSLSLCNPVQDVCTRMGPRGFEHSSHCFWKRTTEGLLEINQKSHKHYNVHSRKLTTIDRFFVASTSHLISQMYTSSFIVDAPDDLHHRGISDHAPVGLILRLRPSRCIPCT